jgi:hypothetical protein
MMNAKNVGHLGNTVKKKATEIYPFLEMLITRKEQQISEIEQVVARYEQKRMKEEQAFQAMSSFRRMLTGKKPSHHLAVEYIHYVRKPMEQARRLREEVERARALLNQSQVNGEIELPADMDSI